MTRTSGIVALVAGPLAFLLWKKRREALLFAAAMLPAVAGWMLWSKFHRTATHDVILIYNTDYLAYLALNMRLSDGSNILWKNVGHALYSLGALALPLELDSFFWQMIRTTAGVAAIAGIARKRADPRLWPFTMVAILTLTELLLWPATPNLRLMYPLTPLFAAGLIWEAEHFCRNLRRSFQRPERSQRFAAWLIGSAGATALAAAIAMPLFMDFAQLPGTVSDNERVRAENLQAYRWIESNLNPRARILSANPAMYLHTSRRTANVVCPEINWYREDAAASLAVFNGLPAYAAANGFGYVYMHVSDYGAITPDHAAEARHTMETSTMLHAIFHSGGGTLYQVSGPVRRAAR